MNTEDVIRTKPQTTAEPKPSSSGSGALRGAGHHGAGAAAPVDSTSSETLQDSSPKGRTFDSASQKFRVTTREEDQAGFAGRERVLGVVGILAIAYRKRLGGHSKRSKVRNPHRLPAPERHLSLRRAGRCQDHRCPITQGARKSQQLSRADPGLELPGSPTIGTGELGGLAYPLFLC